MFASASVRSVIRDPEHPELAASLHRLLDAALAFGADVTLFASQYPGAIFDDAMSWLYAHHDECSGSWKEHVAAFMITRRNPERVLLTVYRDAPEAV